MISILLSSCAAPKVATSINEFRESSNNGLIVGTISFPTKKPRFNSYFPSFFSINENKRSEIQIKPRVSFGERHVGEIEEGKTYLFCLEKSPSNFEINSVRLSLIGIGGSVRDIIIKDFSIPFEVKKGEIVYVGEITINENSLENNPIKFSDKFDRDIEAFKTFYPLIHWDDVVNSKATIIYK